MQPWKIRQARPDDSAQIISGLNTICAEGGAFYITHFVPDEPWQTVLAAPESTPQHLLLLAELDGTVIGAGNLFTAPAHTLCTHTADLGIFVLNPYRRQGIGRQLMQGMCEWAAKRELEKITLQVFATNYAAISLYSICGFVEEGRQIRQIKQTNQYIDMVHMAYFLS